MSETHGKMLLNISSSTFFQAIAIRLLLCFKFLFVFNFWLEVRSFLAIHIQYSLLHISFEDDVCVDREASQKKKSIFKFLLSVCLISTSSHSYFL